MSSTTLPGLLSQVRACTECQHKLPLGPRPLVAAHEESRILIIGQAPGRVAHETGVPWGDQSGDRLRQWMNVSPKLFYNPRAVAIMSMALCYPGTGRSGDLPPSPECAPLWHSKLRAALPNIALTLYLGRFAIDALDKTHKKSSLSKLIKNWPDHLSQGYFLLPHPSPRNRRWFSKNSYFENELIPALQAQCSRILNQ